MRSIFLLLALLSACWSADYPPVVINANGHTQNLQAGDNVSTPAGSALHPSVPLAVAYGGTGATTAAAAATALGLGTGNYVQFTGMTASGPVYAQTLNATGASVLAGVTMTSLVNSGATTTQTLNATGASTLAGVTATSLTNSGLTSTQTLNATGASSLAGVSCTSLVNSGTETVNALSSTGAATIAGALTATGAATFAGGTTVEDPTDPTKKLTFSLSGGTTNVPITLAISANASARTYTIPTDSSDSFAMLGLSQTFTGYIKTTFVTDTTSTTTGSLLTSGGLAVAKGICDGGGFMDASNVASSFSTGGSATVAANVLTEINTNTSTIATFYLWLPAAPNNGQIIDFVTGGIISAITVGGNGHTIIAAPTSCTANTTYRWIYNSAATTWYREQ